MFYQHIHTEKFTCYFTGTTYNENYLCRLLKLFYNNKKDMSEEITQTIYKIGE